jgi:ComF family protein
MMMSEAVKGARRHELQARLLDALFPPKCAGCKVRGHWLCPDCLRRIDRFAEPLCAVCRQPLALGVAHGCGRNAASVSLLVAVGFHAGPLREAIHALKYQGRHGIAATLAGLLTPLLTPLLQEGDLVVPVPLHPSRERERGYNQSARLAAELAYLHPVEVVPAALRRTRATAQQTTLSGTQRAANVRGAFEASPLVVGRRVWLLDDVCTTGATLGACAQALRQAGARQVLGAVVALAPHHGDADAR